MPAFLCESICLNVEESACERVRETNIEANRRGEGEKSMKKETDMIRKRENVRWREGIIIGSNYACFSLPEYMFECERDRETNIEIDR